MQIIKGLQNFVKNLDVVAHFMGYAKCYIGSRGTLDIRKKMRLDLLKKNAK